MSCCNVDNCFFIPLWSRRKFVFYRETVRHRDSSFIRKINIPCDSSPPRSTRISFPRLQPSRHRSAHIGQTYPEHSLHRLQVSTPAIQVQLVTGEASHAEFKDTYRALSRRNYMSTRCLPIAQYDRCSALVHHGCWASAKKLRPDGNPCCPHYHHQKRMMMAKKLVYG